MGKLLLNTSTIFFIEKRRMLNMNQTKALFYSMGTLLLLVAIGAIPAGIGFISKPDGSNLSMSVNLLKDSPFKDFLIPGILLLTIHGLGSLLGSFLSFKHHSFAITVTLVLGFAMVVWIVAQVYWLGLKSILQPTFFVVGVIEIILGLVMYKKKLGN
ncbi:hypothetical protein [Lysinibacillus sp. NPDC047702]|uniref:hypothetical protein n=1 Tax=unclassified Lysinibacillus TaxID=2636778 RepID=UPI003CFC4636